MASPRLTTLVLAASAAALLASCGMKEPPATARASTSWSAQQLIDASREAALSAMKKENRGKAEELALQGIDAAERCLMVAPEEPGCSYWRAVNTGLYHRVHIIGYQKGVKRMIEDCQKVIQVEPGYDHAGAYRILGQLYTKLPQTGGSPESVTRDLPLAEKYLREAIKIAPDYPENYIALAETLLAEDKIPDTAQALENARNLVPRWKSDASYDEWHSTLFALEKKVKRN